MTKIIINSEPDSCVEYLKKIWLHKSLIVTLAKRDLKAKYAQTVLGLAWTIIQPLTAVLIYTVFFSGLLNFQTEYSYVLFVLSGMLLWNLFNYIFSQGGLSLMQNQDIIKKMAFPKIIIPISKILLALVEFGVTFFLLIILMIIFKVPFKLSFLLFPIIITPLIMCSLGVALILSATALKKRDIFHIAPFLINFGIWLTPVFYPVTIIPEKFANLIYINPIAASIQLFRWSLFGDPLNSYIIIGLSLSFLIFIIGFFVFKKIDDKIIDVI